MKLRKSLLELLNKIENDEFINWSDWKTSSIKDSCNFFIEIKFCKKYDDLFSQYNAFLSSINMVYNNKERMLFETISASPGLKQYLQIHSVFKIDANSNGDWFNHAMINILQMTDEEVENVFKKEFVPPEILEKLKIFNPEPIGFEVDNIRIEYDFWGRGGPIRVIDIDWENISKLNTNIPEFLAQYEAISIKPNENTASQTLIEVDDDLPF